MILDFQLIGDGFVRKVANKACVRLGEDPWVGSGMEFVLPYHMIPLLREMIL